MEKYSVNGSIAGPRLSCWVFAAFVELLDAIVSWPMSDDALGCFFGPVFTLLSMTAKTSRNKEEQVTTRGKNHTGRAFFFFLEAFALLLLVLLFFFFLVAVLVLVLLSDGTTADGATGAGDVVGAVLGTESDSSLEVLIGVPESAARSGVGALRGSLGTTASLGLVLTWEGSLAGAVAARAGWFEVLISDLLISD
jgi:hypothetical protein